MLGGPPAAGSAQLARVGFVAQDTPRTPACPSPTTCAFGAHLNPGWDKQVAADRIAQLGLDPAQKAGKLSGGQRAQLALTLAIAKRPELLILDEPVASLDPLARREFLRSLMEYIAEHKASVILSSHLVSDLERVCDYMIVLVESRVQVAGDVDELLATHYRLTGPRRDADHDAVRGRGHRGQPHRPAVHPDRAQQHADRRSLVDGRAPRPRRPRPRLHGAAQSRDPPRIGDTAMIWFTCASSGPTPGSPAAGLAVAGVVLTITGLWMADLYANSGLADLPAGLRRSGRQLPRSDRAGAGTTALVLIAVPALIGIFWGRR